MPALRLLAGAIPWRLVAIIGLALGLSIGAIYVVAQLKSIGRLQAEVGIAAAAAALNANQVKIERAAYAAREIIATKWVGDRDLIKTRATGARKEIANAPASDDGPVAPVLGRELERLRGSSAGGKDRGAAALGDPGGLPAAVPKAASPRP